MNRTLSMLLLLVLSADALLMFLVPVMVYGYTASLAWSGLAYALAWLPRLLLVPLVGASIDHWGVRRVCVVSDLAKCASCLAVIVMLSRTPSALAVTVAGGLLGAVVAIGNAQSLIAYEKLIALVSTDVDRDVNVLCRVDQMAMVAGPFVGFVGYAAGPIPLMVLAGVFYLLNAAWYGLSDVVAHHDICGSHAEGGQALENLKRIVLTPLLMSTVLLALGNNAFDGLVEAGAVSLIDRAMQLPIQYFAFVDICAGLCGVIATLAYPALAAALSPLRLFVLAAAVTVVASGLMVVFQAHLVGFLALYAFNIGGKVFLGNFCRALRIRLVSVERLGSVSSLMVLMNQAILPVVGLTLYLLGDQRHSLSGLLLSAIVVTLIASVLIGYQMANRPVPTLTPGA